MIELLLPSAGLDGGDDTPGRLDPKHTGIYNNCS